VNLTEPSPHNGPALVRLKHIRKSYRALAGEVPILHDINLELNAGEFVGIIGKSGSGKSTLLNMITGIDRPTSGEVWIGDTPIHKLSEGQMAVWRGQQLGIIFQFFQLLPMLSLVENIMLPMDFAGRYSSSQRSVRAMELLDLVELADHAHKLPAALSGGQQQRVAIARALANDPPLLVADEPTGNLDSKTAESVFALFQNLVKQGKTVIMVTHDGSLARRASRTILLADGQVVNEYVARALPTLTMDQMIYVTRHLTPHTFEPGAAIFSEGRPGDQFYIITRGTVEIALQRPHASDIVVAQLTAGQYFGEIELLRGGPWAATARAAATGPVELATLDRATFKTLLDESEVTREALGRVAATHLQENRSIREAVE
jgi:ABC-type lipoprotein export system ATPase subunit